MAHDGDAVAVGTAFDSPYYAIILIAVCAYTTCARGQFDTNNLKVNTVVFIIPKPGLFPRVVHIFLQVRFRPRGKKNMHEKRINISTTRRGGCLGLRRGGLREMSPDMLRDLNLQHRFHAQCEQECYEPIKAGWPLRLLKSN